MNKLISKLRKYYESIKWKPDFSNPDDIRRFVIKECNADTLWMVFGLLLMISGAIESIVLVISFQSVVDAFVEKEAIGEWPTWVCNWGPLVVFLNGLILSLFAMVRGLKCCTRYSEK